MLPKPDNNIRLIEPIESLHEDLRAYAQEFGENRVIGSGIIDETDDFSGLIRAYQDHAKGINLPEGWVPYSSYWLVRGDERILGLISLRHTTTPFLFSEGGHIGYSVRPSERRKGYATRMLALTLTKAKDLGLKRVLITCDKNNVASSRVIQNNGGILEDEILSVLPNREITQRYWIEL